MEKRREEMDLVETYKIINGISDVDPAHWFTLNTAVAGGGPTTRRAADPLSIRQQPARLELRRNFFSMRVCETWNSLPSEVKKCKNVGHFKSALRKHVTSTPA